LAGPVAAPNVRTGRVRTGRVRDRDSPGPGPAEEDQP
jgi:hypothetical protein